MAANAQLEEPSRPRTANSIPDRQLRPRNHGGSKAPLSLPSRASSRRSSTMSDMTGPHRRSSRSEPLHLPADRVRMSNRSAAPTRTKTGRISKALKGVKVHECCQCGKVYSRAEHLRRHQYNHQGSPQLCNICNKAFYRDDLLARHRQKCDNNHQRSSSECGASSPYSERPTSSRSTSAMRPSPPTTAPLEDRKSNVATDMYGPPPGLSSHLIQQQTHLGLFAHYSVAPSYAFPQPTTWKSEPGFEPILPVSPEPWTVSAPQYPPPVIGPVEPVYPSPFQTVDWAGINHQLQSPDSTVPPIWSIPAIDHDKSLRTSTSSSPVSAVPPILLPLSGAGGAIGPEDSLQDGQLGVSLSIQRKRAYVEAYWRYFHPLFPIMHRQRFTQYTQVPGAKLLLAAMMAIGAQYAQELFAGSDSRILHEKCQELIAKNKDTISKSNKLEIMQAVVLVEFMSHFKAKRAPDDLSEVFRAVYDKLWHGHFNQQSRSAMDTLGELPQHCGDETVQLQWAEWIASHSQERLLVACYILDSRQALLLGRRAHIPDAAAGLELFVPTQHALWDAASPSQWAQRSRALSAATVTVGQLLDGVRANAGVTCDSFQSALVLACHAASATTSPSPSHAAFGPARHAQLAAALASHPSVRIMHGAARLIALAPFRALVATASESWFFSRKLAGDAREAADEFSRLRRRLREWTTDSSAPSSKGNVPGPARGGAPSAFLTATGVALDILRQAVAVPEPHLTLSFGPEMALHVAALALWAATFAGLTHPRGGGAAAAGASVSAVGGAVGAINPAAAAAAFSADADVAEWEPLRAENLVKGFLPQAAEDVEAAILSAAASASGTASPIGGFVALDATAPFPPPGLLKSWVTGVGSVIRWTAWVLGGSGYRGSGSGELIEGAIGVLEKLGRSGWVQSWF